MLYYYFTLLEIIVASRSIKFNSFGTCHTTNTILLQNKGERTISILKIVGDNTITYYFNPNTDLVTSVDY